MRVGEGREGYFSVFSKQRLAAQLAIRAGEEQGRLRRAGQGWGLGKTDHGCPVGC